MRIINGIPFRNFLRVTYSGIVDIDYLCEEFRDKSEYFWGFGYLVLLVKLGILNFCAFSVGKVLDYSPEVFILGANSWMQTKDGFFGARSGCDESLIQAND